MQHAALGLFKEMLFTLDLAQQAGTKADRLAAERLQHRCVFTVHWRMLLLCSTLVTLADCSATTSATQASSPC